MNQVMDKVYIPTPLLQLDFMHIGSTVSFGVCAWQMVLLSVDDVQMIRVSE
jgi:hypothetical protein